MNRRQASIKTSLKLELLQELSPDIAGLFFVAAGETDSDQDSDPDTDSDTDPDSDTDSGTDSDQIVFDRVGEKVVFSAPAEQK